MMEMKFHCFFIQSVDVNHRSISQTVMSGSFEFDISFSCSLIERKNGPTISQIE